jgi:hypothetical protein
MRVAPWKSRASAACHERSRMGCVKRENQPELQPGVNPVLVLSSSFTENAARMNGYSFGLKLVSGTVLAFAVLAAVALWLKGPGAPRVMEPRVTEPRVTEPKDQELISTFHAHRQAFEQLQEMATQDARRGWYLAGNDPHKPDQPRRAEYKNLISQIRPGLQVAMTGPTGVVRFIFVGEGTAIGPDWVKGIEYVPGDYEGEGVLLPDLDKAASLPARVYIREIEPRWLIFYQRDE